MVGRTALEPQGAAEQGYASPRVLLADDDETLRILLTRALRLEGCQVVVTNDGRQALAAWPSNGPAFELVILDLNMPGHNGYEVYCELTRRYPATYFLFITGYLDPSLHQTLTCAHNAQLLFKPFSLHQFRERVGAFLRGMHAGARPASPNPSPA